MPEPDLKSFGSALYRRMTPVAVQDADLGWPLAGYCGGIGEMFQIVNDYCRAQAVDGKRAVGWSQLLDVNRCPVAALPWLGQFVGVVVDPSLSEEAQRAQVKYEGGWRRGTPAALVAAAVPLLTGTQSVTVIERDPAACPAEPAYGISVFTRDAETPDSAAVLAALKAAKCTGLVLNYQVLADYTYGDLYSAYATYGDVYSSFHTYEGVFEGNPGT